MDQTTTEQKILAAAKEVFVKGGLQGARMQDIADAAGINKALLHYYFRSKELLFNKVFEEAFLNYLNTMRIWDESDLDIKERLYRYVDNYITFLTEYPLVPLFIIKELSSDDSLLKEKITQHKQQRSLPNLIDCLRKELAGHPSGIQPEMLLMNIQSLCAYPFLAEPLFKGMLKIPQEDWDHLRLTQLKETVKKFIHTTLEPS